MRKNLELSVDEMNLFRTSEKSCFQECRQKWDWAYRQQLRSTRVRSPLIFGTWIHEALELWYVVGKKRGVHPAETFARLWDEHLRGGGEEVMVGEHPAGDLGVHMLENYVAEYGQDDWMEVIQPELVYAVHVRHPKSGRYLFTAVGTVDVTIRDLRSGKVGFVEHKTGASLDPFGAPLVLDEQNGAYWTYAPEYLRSLGVLKKSEMPHFMLYNRLRKDTADTRPANEHGVRLNKPSKAALEACLVELGVDRPKGAKVADLAALVAAEGQDPAQLGEPSLSQPAPLFKREYIMRGAGDRVSVDRRTRAIAREISLINEGKLEVYKQPGKHCGYCEFREMCEVHESGTDWESLKDNMFRVSDPYEEYKVEIQKR